MAKRDYATAHALRQALEARLVQKARTDGTPVQRLRFSVAFDRFLARVSSMGGSDWTLKGGYAMELRIERARTTKDIDLSLRMFGGMPPPTDLGVYLREHLQRVAEVDLGDFFEFIVGAPVDDVTNAAYGGVRFPVTAYLDARVFQAFRVDIVIGDPPTGDGEELEGEDWLGFAGIPPAKITVIKAEQQFAEKLHAYTFPRQGSPNSRVKDLVDMVLLIKADLLDREATKVAVGKTFARRGTHALPSSLAPPPDDWPRPYAPLAAECGLSETLDEAFAVVATFLTPILNAAAE